ncbi:translocation/assembly module TamB domain-containing protein [Phenylobacterium sp.]|uniref:translocation/assembly module TamB domain-containing protein n=1 Tax=Phenylobacterium sp. TaxID=1871053 RepID=UPI002735A85A|nr:translocation/assembly module TamB domain-containing protein [Phenylobacterium sp.]MDP3658874.1 translocation/assembly module TamB domain-containing protein [Phenylobacterium sp.]
MPKIIVAVCAVLFLLIGGAFVAARYGVVSSQGRLLLEARLEGLKIGRFGKLRIEGLDGDVWRDFTVRRLTIADEKGVWLEASKLHVTWRYGDLLRRSFHADSIDAESLRLLRRPTLTPKGKAGGLPVSFHIARLGARVELAPAFSYRRGLYDVTGALDVARGSGGRQSGRVAAKSLLHAGDHLRVRFDLGKNRPMLVEALAEEASGGALAGALGLPADQPFSLAVRADGQAGSGKFTAIADSGQQRPLSAKGAWRPYGGQAGGRIELASSRLTAPLVARFGPQARFAFGSRRAPDGLYAVDVRLGSANLNATAKGFADFKAKRAGPKGLTLTADARALSKITGGPATGAGRLAGVLTGDAKDLRFAGEGSVDHIGLGGYVLSRVSGPLNLSRRNGDLGVEAKLTGAGGAGRGLAAALLGARPTLALDAQRLGDGRLSLRRLDVAGSGLKVEASGGRSLLGGLNFKGRVLISNLAAARAGASGGLDADWSAVQGGAGKPWTVSLDAKGQRFATGYPEADRLLGPAPRLEARANIAGRQVSVAQAKLAGASLKAETAGVLGSDGALKFKLDWTADGPFRAGPVEITGRAKGTGAIGGSLAQPRADLIADFDVIDVPRLPLKAARVTLNFQRRTDGAAGLVTIAAESEYGPARARSDFRFPHGGVDLTNLAVDAGGVKASGALTLRRRTPSTADLTVEAGPGAFLTAGSIAGRVRIVDGRGGAQANLALTADGAALRGSNLTIRNGSLNAEGPMARLPYRLKAEGRMNGGAWNLDGGGTLAEAKPGYELAFSGAGKAGTRAVRTVEPAVLRFGGPERSARLRLAAADGGRVNVDARLSGGGAEIRAQVAKLGLEMLNEDLTGRFDADMTLNGRGARLDGVMSAKLDGARGRGANAASGLDGALRARLAGDSLTLDLDATNSEGLKANGAVTVPVVATAAPVRIAVARTRPMSGRFFAEGEIRPLWDLLIGGERSLSGHVRTEGTLAGTLADPRAVGQAAVDAGRFEDGATGLLLRDVVVRAQFANTAIDVTQASGADGHGGTLSGKGRINLTREGASSFRLDLKGFRLIDNEQATASATGPVTIDRAASGQVRLSGALAIDRADVAADPPTPSGVVSMEVVERNVPDTLDRGLPAQTKRGGNGWVLDVTLQAPRRVFLRGRGLDLELSLDARVAGSTARPVLSGTARIVRGDYDFAGKRFTFDTQSVVYLSTRAQEIRLDLTATRDDPALTAAVRIRGTAAKPEITLTSSPVLPNDEVLSQVLFGRSASQLSPLEAAQLASALSALAGGGGFDLIGELRGFAGLDRLALGGGDASGVTVSGGKYLTDNVYLEITGGGREGPSAQVEWRVGRSLSILSKLAGQKDAKLAVRWRRDY